MSHFWHQGKRQCPRPHPVGLSAQPRCDCRACPLTVMYRRAWKGPQIPLHYPEEKTESQGLYKGCSHDDGDNSGPLPAVVLLARPQRKGLDSLSPDHSIHWLPPLALCESRNFPLHACQGAPNVVNHTRGEEGEGSSSLCGDPRLSSLGPITHLPLSSAPSSKTALCLPCCVTSGASLVLTFRGQPLVQGPIAFSYRGHRVQWENRAFLGKPG